jgi:hypothetical protein
MAAPIDTSLTGEIWHLSIEDLLAPLPQTMRLGGPGPFVINLSTSSSPIASPIKSMAGCEHAHMYQVQRTEDGRPRYRLRVGPFATEDAAQAILKRVREIYPGALTATADSEDMRMLAALQPRAQTPSIPRVTLSKAAAVSSIPTVTLPKAAAVSSIPTVTLPKAAAVSSIPTVTLPKAAAVSSIPTVMLSKAAAVSSIPTVTLPKNVIAPPVLTAAQKARVHTPQAAPVPAPAAPIQTPTAKPAASIRPSVNSPPVLTAGHRVPVQQRSSRLPDLESTQTVRALTQFELESEQVSPWYVIQLSLAEDAFDPETVPNLDIFSVYRLYSVAGIDQGRIVHALRLGFFSAESAAAAVASYLTEFYDKPTIKRVSAAERQRFADQPLEPRKDVGATGKHAVIEITSERFVRERRSTQPARK